MLDRPIIFIGMPRSGTTILFERFALHPQLGWLSNYCEKYPGWPFLNMLCPLMDNQLVSLRGEKKQYEKIRLGNRFLPRPNESYAFWEYYTDIAFSRSYLLDTAASAETVARVRSAVSQVLRYQRKQRFTTKLTGPGRIAYLSSIFPDAVFVHVVRDGRSVVHSLMKVEFWREKGGFEAPFWDNGFPPDSLEYWEKTGRAPEVLAALQWVNIVRSIRHEASRLEPARYLEVRYEDLLGDSAQVLKTVDEAAALDNALRMEGRDRDSASLHQCMNRKFREQMSPDIIARLDEIMDETLAELGYT